MISRQLFFNELATIWEERFHTQEVIYFLKKIVPKFGLRKGQKILDVGTGTGILISFLLHEVGSSGHIEAIDFADKMIKVCKSKYGKIPNVSFKLQNVEKINYASESFDAVTCFGVFPHLENKLEALQQINRVLKPKGKLIIIHALSSQEIKAHHKNSSSIVAQDTLPKKTEMIKILQQTKFYKIVITDKPGSYLCLSYKPSI